MLPRTLARCALFLATPLFLLGVETMPATQQLHAHDLIHVSNCHPSMNEMTSYPPAYYPYAGRPYGWTNVYGYAYTMPPVTTTSPALQIDYRNVYTKTMKDIEFGLVARGVLVAEVKDVGKFSPGAEVNSAGKLHARPKFVVAPPRNISLSCFWQMKLEQVRIDSLKSLLSDDLCLI